jgi:hypothetical protein
MSITPRDTIENALKYYIDDASKDAAEAVINALAKAGFIVVANTAPSDAMREPPHETVDMSQAYSAEELREMFLDEIDSSVVEWTKVKDYSNRDRLSGLVHSILCAIDGVSGGFPMSLNLVVNAHHDDKADAIAEGRNWIEPETVLNEDSMLHESWGIRERARRERERPKVD